MNIAFFYPPTSAPRGDNNGNKNTIDDDSRPKNDVGDTPTSTSAHPGNSQHHGSGSGAMIGKFEQKLGSFVGSDGLKAKGLQKEHEAHAAKVQNKEGVEAEGADVDMGHRAKATQTPR
ncbi:hypothetical protein B0H16DRAFT_1593700 [Mycena metata]|uniref:Uncharacterized protein n=1 Tax=Mycena metata TaxID=1033252 RepID=A0AAD7HQ34_9AGAR|nr:hypothetical protein B0H16DRAFT_1593700 [Mycena metata]